MIKKEQKNSMLALVIQVVAILLVGVISSVGMFWYIKDKNTERYTVTFAYGDGTVIEEKTVKSGCGVVPPIIETNDVFRGWDVIINNVTSNLETHPQFYKIAEDNLFYFDSVYVKEGKKFTIDLMLSGNVHVSKGELTLYYDKNVMFYESYIDSDFINIIEPTPGELIISFDSREPLTVTTSLTQIEFRSKKMDVKYSQITLMASKMIVDIKGKEQPADCATINNNIYFLQGVSQ